MNRLILFLSFFLAYASCSIGQPTDNKQIIPGADQTELYLPLLKNKKIALVVNQTSIIDNTHLVDSLKNSGVDIVKVFAPEHGFRGDADAGEKVKDGVDLKTGIPIISLYGSNKKPSPEQLEGVDLIIFDIQDVGTRFYTYISTMHYVMEACAENNKEMIILDRPNPNGMYIDGPILRPAFKSFVGMHPIPILHGLTVGELALMINGQGWLNNEVKCDIKIIPVKNYTHKMAYSLPVKPSPNLPNDLSIKLYPSLCLFEGTIISVGRGTHEPFQQIGHPELKGMPHQFIPEGIEGMDKNPLYKGKSCYGLDFQKMDFSGGFSLQYLVGFYQRYPGGNYFNTFFDKLAGTDSLRIQINQGLDESEIRETWKAPLVKYRKMRKQYLLYAD